jgi:hypothetical protein
VYGQYQQALNGPLSKFGEVVDQVQAYVVANKVGQVVLVLMVDVLLKSM